MPGALLQFRKDDRNASLFRLAASAFTSPKRIFAMAFRTIASSSAKPTLPPHHRRGAGLPLPEVPSPYVGWLEFLLYPQSQVYMGMLIERPMMGLSLPSGTAASKKSLLMLFLSTGTTICQMNLYEIYSHGLAPLTMDAVLSGLTQSWSPSMVAQGKRTVRTWELGTLGSTFPM